MSFTSPLWLLLLGLLPLIVILHAVAVRWRSMPVSSLVFWDDVLRQRRVTMRIRRLLRSLSLLLELLAVAALAVALAGPRVNRPGLSGTGDTILVLDATASMQAREGGRSRFDLARARALELLAGLRRGTRAALVLAERAPRLVVPFTADRVLLRRALDAATASDEAGDMAPSLGFAASLRDPRRGDQIVLLTDGAYDEISRIDLGQPWVHVLLVGTPRANVGITGLAFRRTLEGADAYEVFLSIVNAGPRAQSVPLTVTAAGRTVISRSVALAAGASSSLSLPWTGPVEGRIEAALRTGDDLAVDDHAYAVFAPARRLTVLVVGNATYFLRRALASLPGVTVIAAPAPAVSASTAITPAAPRAATTGAASGTADVIAWEGVDPPVLEKGAWMIFGAVPPNLPLTATGVLTLPAVTGWAQDDPLLDSVPLQGLAIGRALDLEAGPGFTVLARSGASPLLLSWDHGGVKALVAAFDPQGSDLPLRPGFPLLVANALAWFFPGWLTVQADQVAAGTPRALSVPSDVAVTVRSPSGSVDTLAPTSAAVFTATREVGFYTVRSGVQTSEFAVNLASAAESDLSPRLALPATGGDADAAGVAGAAVPAWGIFGAAALAFLLLEWAVWLRTRRVPR
jgi:Ca-activated chloride channel homolog